jgi:hypothetical protein
LFFVSFITPSTLIFLVFFCKGDYDDC